MIPVSEARARLFDLVAPLTSEAVPLAEADGRVLTQDIVASRDQPPFAASSMDGYAIKADEAERDAMFRVIGEAAAGHAFPGEVGAGEAVRIFTGAPLPEGASFVVIQEDVTRSGSLITITGGPGTTTSIRPAGGDFRSGQRIRAPRVLDPQHIALAAAMNTANLTVARKPVVALISTGDELVMPGGDPRPDQIIASNTFGLKAMLQRAGAEPRILPIARDTHASLTVALEMALSADLIVTIGGASVGDHDLVADVADAMGMERSFYKVAMRPGKPLMSGRLRGVPLVGLPGNPVSAMVCGRVFLLPLIRKMLGLGEAAPDLREARLAEDLPENGPREHYMRAIRSDGEIRAWDNQDSSLLTILAQANALLVRAPGEPARRAGEMVPYLDL